MFTLTLDPITGKATLDGIPIETVEGLVEVLAQQTARIEALEALTAEDRVKLNSALEDIKSLLSTVAYLQSEVNKLKASTPTPTPAPTPTPTPAPTGPYVLLDRTNWTATGSNIPAGPDITPQACIDDFPNNRYLSQVNQYPGMYLEFNFNGLIYIRQFEIAWSGNHWARNFKLLPSLDGQTYTSPVFSGAGVDPTVSATQKIQVPAFQARKLRLEINESFDDWLSLWQFMAYS